MLKYDSGDGYRSGTPCTDAEAPLDPGHTRVVFICGDAVKLAVVYEQDSPAVKVGSYQINIGYDPAEFGAPTCVFNPKNYFDMGLVTECPSAGGGKVRGSYFNDAAAGWSVPYPAGVELADVEFATITYDPANPPASPPELVFDLDEAIVYDYDVNNLNPEVMDAFVSCRDLDVAPPSVVDFQQGDDEWRAVDPGAVYDVDFADTGGSGLSEAQYSVWGSEWMMWDEIVPWTDVASNVGGDEYSANWGVAFSQLREGVNYVSVRARDGDGNWSAVATDAFYIKKNALPPGEVEWLTAEAWDGGVMLAWGMPADGDFAAVRIMRKLHDYPQNASDGFEVYVGPDPGAFDVGLVNGTTYYYTAFAYDQAGGVSSGAASGARAFAMPDVESGLVLHKGWNHLGGAREGAAVDAGLFATSGYYAGAYSGGVFSFATQAGPIALPFAGGMWIYSGVETGSVAAGGTDYSSSSYEVSLAAGWNEFSPPFVSSLPWDAGHSWLFCEGRAAVLPPVYRYEGGVYTKVAPDDGNSLRPWKAYAIKSPGACVLRMSK